MATRVETFAGASAATAVLAWPAPARETGQPEALFEDERSVGVNGNPAPLSPEPTRFAKCKRTGIPGGAELYAVRGCLPRSTTTIRPVKQRRDGLRVSLRAPTPAEWTPGQCDGELSWNAASSCDVKGTIIDGGARSRTFHKSYNGKGTSTSGGV